MRLLIVSDIHGSRTAAEKIDALFETLAPDYLCILGDILYHGPRNPLPGGHSPEAVAAILNKRKDNIIAVRGNCDAEVDQLLLDFPCLHGYALLADGSLSFFLTHGHLYPDLKPPFSLKKGSVFLFGHTHIGLIEEKGGLIYCNPGSVSLPKGIRPVQSYALYDKGLLSLCALDGGAALLERRLG